LSLKKVSKWFGGLPALQDVSFGVPRGRVTALIGPNGAGKSTLINCISGVDTAASGQILLETRPIERLPAHGIADLGVARTFQNLKLFARLSVLDNVLTGLDGGGRAFFCRFHAAPAGPASPGTPTAPARPGDAG
jgi:branched-chain amino acid transport system ATP-binding protein